MRGKVLMLAVLAVLFVGCESNREKFAKQFSEGCQYNSNFDGPNADIFCVCMAEFYASQFSDKELDLMKKFESPYYQPQSLEEMNARVFLNEKMTNLEYALNKDKNIIRAFAKHMAKCGKAKGLVELTEERVLEIIK